MVFGYVADSQTMPRLRTRRLLVATNNTGKLREMLSLLEGTDLDIVSPEDIGVRLSVAENGATYAENASLKAHAFSHASGLVTMADDSGLEVDALGGLPGIHSARFSPKPHATDADRRAHLLEMLKGHLQPWIAHFHCTVAVATPDGEIYYAQGDCPGEVIPQERGTNGFGYDPIFLLSEIGLTMAELNMQEKNRLSHRARAVKSAIPVLTDIFRHQQ